MLLPAQHSGRKPSQLRATAILELSANGRARLVPVVIKVGDKFFDGGLYRADPSPLALDSGTVYEAERSGDPLGLFTISQSQNVGGVWIGLGLWRAKTAPSPEGKPSPSPSAGNSVDEDRPILRRPNSGAAQPSPEATPAPMASPAASPSPTPAHDAMEQDPNRPILRRGKPTAGTSTDGLAPLVTERPGATHSVAGAVEVLTAISDAGGPDPHPFTMQLKPEESARYEQAVRQLAHTAIRKYAAGRAPHPPAALAEMTDARFRVFDARGNNEPDLVFSAALPEQLPRGASSQLRYQVTVVARVDIYGELRQLFAQVTDNAHLDVFPRLELVDVVDAEGSGTGQFLFRQISDTGYAYALYRVGADQLWLLFQGAPRNF